MLGKSQNPSHLLEQARSEAIAMIERAREVFDMAWTSLEGNAGGDPSKLEQEINSSERLVRRLVLEHLTMRPDQDLSYSLTLVSIVHDLERLGDYGKSIAELAESPNAALPADGLGARCRTVKDEIRPLFDLSAAALRDDDEEKAADVMERHRRVKEATDRITEEALAAEQSTAGEVMSVLAARYLRRISAHLSNVSSSVVKPFDLIARNE